jgi:hypothetical protein
VVQGGHRVRDRGIVTTCCRATVRCGHRIFLLHLLGRGTPHPLRLWGDVTQPQPRKYSCYPLWDCCYTGQVILTTWMGTSPPLFTQKVPVIRVPFLWSPPPSAAAAWISGVEVTSNVCVSVSRATVIHQISALFRAGTDPYGRLAWPPRHPSSSPSFHNVDVIYGLHGRRTSSTPDPSHQLTAAAGTYVDLLSLDLGRLCCCRGAWCTSPSALWDESSAFTSCLKFIFS